MRKTVCITTAALLLGVGFAQADVSKRVQKAFRGQILLTQGPLPPAAESDKETIKAYKKARLKKIAHAKTGDDLAEWTFTFTAFMKKKLKAKELSMDFYTADKKPLYVANKRLIGITPGVPILSGEFTLTEDDNLNKNRTYVIKLTAQQGKREVVFATTKIKLE